MGTNPVLRKLGITVLCVHETTFARTCRSSGLITPQLNCLLPGQLGCMVKEEYLAENDYPKEWVVFTGGVYVDVGQGLSLSPR